MEPVTDGELLEAFRAGRDERAFAELVARHGAMVHRVAQRVLGDAHAADDVAQEAFLILARRPAIGDASRLAGWLHGTALRLAWRARRSRTRRERREREGGTMPEEPAAELAALRSELDEALARLPARLREAVVLCHLERRTVREAAAHAGIPAGTLGRRSAEGLRLLRELLARRGAAVGSAALAAVLAEEAAAASLPAGLVAGVSGLTAAVASSGAAWLKLAIAAVLVLAAAAAIPLVAGGRAAAPAAASGGAGATIDGLRPTIVSAAPGEWSRPATWRPARVPAAGDVVAVDHAVTYDREDERARMRGVLVRAGGTLSFSGKRPTALVAGSLLVERGGALVIGDDARSIASEAGARLLIDPPDDGGEDSGGLLVRGELRLRGAAKDAFARLAAAPRAGDAELRLATPVSGWRRGDRVVVPDSRQLRNAERGSRYQPQWEERTIVSVSADGALVRLDRPLAFAHPGVEDGATRFMPHVADLTRSIEIAGARSGGRRGYVRCEDGAVVDIGYAAFRGLGRAPATPAARDAFAHERRDPFGRYPLELRRVVGADGVGFTVIGAVVDGGDDDRWRWGLVLDGAENGTIADSIVYGVAGAGFVAADGGERGDRFERDLALRVRGGGTGQDGGFAGDGFWFRGPGVVARDSVAADCFGDDEGGSGFAVFAVYAGTRLTAPGAVDLNGQALAGFAGNEAYMVPNGLSLWWVGTAYAMPRAVDASRVDRFAVWHARGAAVQLHSVNRVEINGLVVRGGEEALDDPYLSTAGVRFGRSLAKDCVVRGADIAGVRDGIVAPSWSAGENVIVDSRLRALAGVRVPAIGGPVAGAMLTPSADGGLGLTPRHLDLRGLRFEPPTVAGGQPPLAIAMDLALGQGVTDLLAEDEVQVHDFGGVAGDDFRLYFAEQAADRVVPVSDVRTRGAPTGGLTNTELWARDGHALGGRIAPAESAARPGIQGLVAPLR